MLRRFPTLGELPPALRNGYLHGYCGPQSFTANKNYPQLLNRQVKVALFSLQETLLEQALTTLRYLLKKPDSWVACLFMSICLSFILERMTVDSREYQQSTARYYKDETATASDVDDFCNDAYAVIFQRIYRQLSLTTRIQHREAVTGEATKQLLQMLCTLSSQLGEFSNLIVRQAFLQRVIQVWRIPKWQIWTYKSHIRHLLFWRFWV